MRNLTTIILFLLSLACQGQKTYKGFLSEGKQWNEHEVYIHRNDQEDVDINQTTYHSYFINGDTIVGGYSCYKLYRSDDTGTSYHCAMYEEGSKVFYIPQGSSDLKLLYDFSKGIREELTDYDSWPKPYVYDVDSIMVGMDSLRRIKYYCCPLKLKNSSNTYPQCR